MLQEIYGSLATTAYDSLSGSTCSLGGIQTQPGQEVSEKKTRLSGARPDIFLPFRVDIKGFGTPLDYFAVDNDFFHPG